MVDLFLNILLTEQEIQFMQKYKQDWAIWELESEYGDNIPRSKIGHNWITFKSFVPNREIWLCLTTHSGVESHQRDILKKCGWFKKAFETYIRPNGTTNYDL